MSSPLQHSPRELKRLQRNLDEALDTTKRQVAVARYQLERKPVDVDAFLRTQILRWEERTDQLIAEGRRHAGE